MTICWPWRPLACSSCSLLGFNGLGVGATPLAPASSLQVWLSTAVSLLLAVGIVVQAVSEARAPRHRFAHRAVLFIAVCDLTLISSVVLHDGSSNPPAAASALALLAAATGALVGIAAIIGRRGRAAIVFLAGGFFRVVLILVKFGDVVTDGMAKDHAEYKASKKQHDAVYNATAQALTDERRKQKWGGWH